MCQVIFLGSVAPLPESDTLGVRQVYDPGPPDAEFEALRIAVPEARHFYQLGSCQCYFGHYPELQIAGFYASNRQRGDLQMAESSRQHFRGVNAFVAGLADYLDDNLAQTPVWMVWKWEWAAVSPGCARWVRSPSYFRRTDFTMPSGEGVITLVLDGPEQPPLPSDLLFHDARDGSGSVRQYWPEVQQTQEFGPGAFTVGWTHIVRVGRRLFFYKADTGEGAVCLLEGGQFTTLTGYPPGTFATGWTHLAQTGADGDEVFFYDSGSGGGVLGRVVEDELTMVKEFPPGTFAQSWTHVIGMPGAGGPLA